MGDNLASMRLNMHLIVFILVSVGLVRSQQLTENQNYLNYQQGQQQGRFLSSFPQSSRNGFFPVQRQGQQQPQAGSYQQQDLYLDGPSTPFFNSYQPFAHTTRAPNLYEISPRPFAVTTSPLQNRGSFGTFGQRSNGFSFGFTSQSDQRHNPYLDTTGFGEVPLSDDYEDRQPFLQSPQRGRVSAEITENARSNFNVPSQPSNSNKSNREKLIDKLKVRPITTPEPIVTTRRASIREREQEAKKTKYTPITRSTTSKKPQSKPTASDNDQKVSFTRNSKVKTTNRDSVAQPVHEYNVNITHSEDELAVKSLDAFRKQQSQEVDDEDVEYEEYGDEDYGVILTEEDRELKEKPTTTVPKTTTTTPVPTTLKPEDNTVIIFENFILPNKNEKEEEQPEEEEEEEYDYVYVDEDEVKATEKTVTTTIKPGTTPKPVTTTIDNLEVTTYRDNNRILSKAVVSVVTSKTVVNGTMQDDKIDSLEIDKPGFNKPDYEETTTEEENYPPTKPTPKKTTTEDYYVIASVQTSRSVSGAHFLPFEHVEQEEKKKSRIELANKKVEETTTSIPDSENDSAEVQDEDDYQTTEDTATTVATTLKYSAVPSTESIIDKLDRVQSDLSLGVLSGEFPVLKDRSAKKSKATTEKPTTSTEESVVEEEIAETPIPTTVKPLVLIRKFSPKTTSASTQKTTTTQKVVFKSTTTEEPTTTVSTTESNQRENKKIAFESIQDDDLAALLPPGYKHRPSYKDKKKNLITTTTTQSPKEENKYNISRAVRPQTNPQLVNTPTLKGFKNKDKLAKTTEDNETENVPKKVFSKLFESSKDAVDISKFLPVDFKPGNESSKLDVIPLENDDLSKFLPPGFKLETTTEEKPKIKILDSEISKFLPPGYKPEQEEKPDDVLSSILGKINFKPPSDLLPTDFKENASETPVYIPATPETPTTAKSSGKVVFPSRLGKKPGQGRMTTPPPNHPAGPKAPEIVVKKGPPTRATTEFTGWPTKATTPISIEKLLELQKNAKEIDISDLLPKSSTTEAPTTTTTTTTTTPRPTQPTVCRTECSLAATIRIIDGVEWSPELLTHHTEEYKSLAAELELELNEVYSNAPSLKQWFKKVRIDSFSKGSVLVDYFVELADIPKDINTVEIKHLFHEALSPAPQQKEPVGDEEEGLPQPITKEAFMLGNFLVDPVSTDFIVIQKVATPPPMESEDNLLPQWAVAMITIGLLSLVCVVLFGVAVLVNRKKAAKKKSPTPLTADMLNELNKNHMGGLENYGADDMYNIDDTWDERRQDVKPKSKRFSNSVNGSNPNIYDSWRSQHLQRYQTDEFYYDSHDPFNELQPKYPQHQNPYSGSSKRWQEPNWQDSAYPPYHGNSSHNYSSRRLRDYDQHF